VPNVSVPKLILCEPEDFSPQALSLLSDRFKLSIGPFNRPELEAELIDADVLFVRLSHMIDAELLHKTNALRVIVSPTTGLNHIDCDTATKMGIEIISLRGEGHLLADIFSTAELTWGLLLSLARRIGPAHKSVIDGEWNRQSFRGQDLHRKTIGIVGLGRLGKMVATYARAFGMDVIYHDPFVEAADYTKTSSLVSLCSDSDIVSLHANWSAENNGFFNETCFGAMKSSTFFINTSRGELVDECALHRALCEKRIAGAAVDVLCEENDKSVTSSRLLRSYAKTHDNLIITPHVGGATLDSMQRTELHLTRKLLSSEAR